MYKAWTTTIEQAGVGLPILIKSMKCGDIVSFNNIDMERLDRYIKFYKLIPEGKFEIREHTKHGLKCKLYRW